MSKESTTTGGVSVASLLGITFIILKLTNVITWSWLWVLSPFWIPLTIFLTVLLIIGLIILITRLIIK